MKILHQLLIVLRISKTLKMLNQLVVISYLVRIKMVRKNKLEKVKIKKARKVQIRLKKLRILSIQQVKKVKRILKPFIISQRLK